MEKLALRLDQEDFFYQEAAVPVIDDIIKFLTGARKSQRTTIRYIWEYPIDPDVWFDYYEHDGYAEYEVTIKVSSVDFEDDHPGWNIDGTSGFGSSSEAVIDIDVQLRPDLLGDAAVINRLKTELYNVVPHELHHLTQENQPFQRINCPLTARSTGSGNYQYFTSECEVPAFLIGFRGEAHQSGREIGELMDAYLRNQLRAGKISSKDVEAIKRTWLGHDAWDEVVKENLIRKYVRSLLVEATQLPQEYFTAIDDAVKASNFWTEPNAQEDIDEYSSSSGRAMGTPAAIALSEALHQAMEDVGLDIDILVRSHYTGDMDGMTLHPDHPAWPNRWLVDARWYISEERPGRNTIDIEIMTSEEDDDILSSLDQAALMRHITQTIRHELVHYEQMKKQADSKELSEMEAFKEMLADPSQVPDRNKPKYWEIYEPTGKIDPKTKKEIIRKEGWKHKEYTQDYLRSHIEVDAHAHDGAEELLAVYGKEASLDMLRYGFNTADPKMPNAIKHYFKMLPEDDPTLDKFRKKLYTQITG